MEKSAINNVDDIKGTWVVYDGMFRDILFTNKPLSVLLESNVTLKDNHKIVNVKDGKIIGYVIEGKYESVDDMMNRSQIKINF